MKPSRAKNWNRGHGGALCSAMLSYTTQDYQPRDGTFTNGLGPTHQSFIKKLLHRFTYRPIWWIQFLSWGSLFTSILYLANKQPIRTHSVTFSTSATVNTAVQTSLQDADFISFLPVSRYKHPIKELSLFSAFWGTIMIFCAMAPLIYILTLSAQKFPLLHTVTSTLSLFSVWDCCAHRCEVTYRCEVAHRCEAIQRCEVVCHHGWFSFPWCLVMPNIFSYKRKFRVLITVMFWHTS